MTSEPDPTVSIQDRVAPVALGGIAVAIQFLGSAAAFVLGDEAIMIVAANGSIQRAVVHRGGILCAAAAPDAVITGGDDGRVCATNLAGETREVAAHPQRRWIDRIATGPGGAIAWSSGKAVFARTADGQERALDLTSSAGGLAFAPKGLRLAASHYDGVTLWFPNAQAIPERLEWKGSHLDVAFSPDGRFLVTAMQEPMLHGWRLMDGKHMRMSGYTGKVRSWSWTAGGGALATSGSEQVILWPFQGKDGPMGKQPRMVAPRELRVVAVACHPEADVLAAGFADGMVVLVRIDDGAEILVRSGSGSPVTALAWSRKGERLAFAAEDGAGGVVPL
jgi:WD40 repeat protein